MAHLRLFGVCAAWLVAVAVVGWLLIVPAGRDQDRYHLPAVPSPPLAGRAQTWGCAPWQ